MILPISSMARPGAGPFDGAGPAPHSGLAPEGRCAVGPEHEPGP